MEPVKVTAKDGKVIHESENPEYGYIRVEQKQQDFKDGFVNVSDLSALIIGKIKVLENLKWKEGDELPGKIKIVESMEPISKNPKYQDRDLKIHSKVGIPFTKNGEPIYRKHFYTTDPNAPDIRIEHDNDDEIAQALEEYSEEGASTNLSEINKAFNLD